MVLTPSPGSRAESPDPSHWHRDRHGVPVTDSEMTRIMIRLRPRAGPAAAQVRVRRKKLIRNVASEPRAGLL